MSNSEYVRLVYQYVLDRDPSKSELVKGCRRLTLGIFNRTQLARRLLQTNESLTRQVNACYEQYLGRSASRSELARSIAALRRGEPSHRVVSRLLSGQEFFNRTQQVVTGESMSER